jgi:CubicO group peptidase (beta-lactamase class C family)
MKRRLFLLAISILALASTSSLPARENRFSALSEAPPQKAGMSAERLARIDIMCQKAVADGDVPGIVALVARRGKIVYYKAFGLAENPSNRPLKRDDIFRIASQTKAITATAVMMLWEEGKFRLDDPISKFIPEFKNPGVLKEYSETDGTWTTEPAKSEITIRHLLTHTSGIGYGVIDGDERFRKIYKKAGITDAFCADPVVLSENIRKLAKLPLHHNPGEKFTYSEGLDVLGYLIEIVSGMPFDQFLRKRMFDPMGMNDTWFYLPQDRASRLVSVQHKKDASWTRFPVTWYDPEYPVKGARMYFAGGAGLSSTAQDYATFLQMYLNGGELNGQRLLSRTTIQTILANQTGDLMSGKGGNAYYGLAFGVLTPEGQAKGGKGSAGTFDWGGYFNTSYFADPKEQVIGVLMKQTQATTTDGTADLFRQLVFQAIAD